MFQSLRELGTEDAISFSFGGRLRTFYVLNIPNKNIHQFQRRVCTLPATPLDKSRTAQFSARRCITCSKAAEEPTRDNLIRRPECAVDGNGNILVADTGNGRIEKFSPTGTFLSIIGGKGSGHGQLADPNGIAIDRAGNIYVAEIGSKHRVQKLAPDGTFIAEWKGRTRILRAAADCHWP